MVRVAASLPTMWETRTQFPDPRFSLAQPWLLCAFKGGVNQWTEDLCMSLWLSHIKKQMKQKHHHLKAKKTLTTLLVSKTQCKCKMWKGTKTSMCLSFNLNMNMWLHMQSDAFFNLNAKRYKLEIFMVLQEQLWGLVLWCSKLSQGLWH